MKQYYLTHKLARSDRAVADADAIVSAVNNSIEGSGDSLNKDIIRKELDAHASLETQKLLKLIIESQEI